MEKSLKIEQTENIKKYEFSAMQLWKMILLFCVVPIPLIYIPTGIAIRIVFPIMFFLILSFFNEKGDSFIIELGEKEDGNVYISNIQIANKIQNIKNVYCSVFLLKNTLIYIFILNNRYYLIYDKDHLVLKRFNTEDRIKYKKYRSKMKIFMSTIKKSDKFHLTIHYLLPLLINLSFYLLLILSFFMIIYILTDLWTGEKNYLLNYFNKILIYIL